MITEKMLTGKQTDGEFLANGRARGNGERRRAKIVCAAMRHFASGGFCGTTTKSIARAAGISEAGLFQYFKTKSELYRAILENKTGEIYEDGWLDEFDEAAAGGDDERVFRRVARKIVGHCERDPEFVRLMFYTALENHDGAQPFRGRLVYPIFERLRDYIETRQRAEVFQKCSAEAAAFAFIGSLIYYALSKILFQSRMLTVSEDEAINDFVKLALDGLRCDISEETGADFRAQNLSKDLPI